jgi:hypothetical protein
MGDAAGGHEAAAACFVFYVTSVRPRPSGVVTNSAVVAKERDTAAMALVGHP